MLNFLDLCSLDIHYDLESNAILVGEHIKYNQFQKIRLRNLSPVLLNKSLTYPEDVYEEYNGVFDDKDSMAAQGMMSYDLINLPAGLLGIEYIKTHVYFDLNTSEDKKISSIVEVLYGSLTVLLQKNKPQNTFEICNRVDEAYLAHINQGEKFVIPNGFYYTFINSSESPVIFSRAYSNYSIADYQALKKERGLAYYCIRKNGRQEIVLNPLYRNTPPIKEVDCECSLMGCQVDVKRSLYEQVRNQINMLVSEISS